MRSHGLRGGRYCSVLVESTGICICTSTELQFTESLPTSTAVTLTLFSLPSLSPSLSPSLPLLFHLSFFICHLSGSTPYARYSPLICPPIQPPRLGQLGAQLQELYRPVRAGALLSDGLSPTPAAPVPRWPLRSHARPDVRGVLRQM